MSLLSRYGWNRVRSVVVVVVGRWKRANHDDGLCATTTSRLWLSTTTSTQHEDNNHRNNNNDNSNSNNNDISNDSDTAQDPSSSFFGDEGTTTSTSTEEATATATATATITTTTSESRNPTLVDVIRGGLVQLNQSALDIQNSFGTKKSLFALVEDTKRIIQAESRQALILRTAREALADVVRTKGLLMVSGEPIELLEAKSKGPRVCSIYWSLPLSVVLSEDLSHMEKQYLEYVIHKRITEQGGQTMLQHRMVHILRDAMGYPPSFRFEPATDQQMQKMIASAQDWDFELEQEQGREEEES